MNRFSRTFRAMDQVFENLSVEMDELLSADGITITNNNGHIVITGPVKSLRVGDQVVDLKDSAK